MYVIYIHQHHISRLFGRDSLIWGHFSLATQWRVSNHQSWSNDQALFAGICGSRGELVNPLTINHTHKSWSWNEKLAKESGVLRPKWFRSNIDRPVMILGILWLNQMWANVAFDSSQPYQDLVTITTLPPHPANITDGKRSSTCWPLPPARLRASAKPRKDIQNSVNNGISKTKTINSCNISATNTQISWTWIQHPKQCSPSRQRLSEINLDSINPETSLGFSPKGGCISPNSNQRHVYGKCKLREKNPAHPSPKDLKDLACFLGHR